MTTRRRRAGRRCAWILLALGIALRVATWALMTPQNRDWHLGVIIRAVDTGRLPITNETDQSYHPPLYYIPTAIIFAVTHRPKIVQLFSLACAVATLLVYVRLIVDTPLVGRMRDRLLLFALVAFNPQLITYGLYISNDTLTIFFGALVAWQLWRWLETPTPARLRWLAIGCGLGLLTKFTFVAIVPVLAVVVAVVSWRVDRATALRRSVEFVAIAGVLGSYKFIENVVHFGSPFVTNFDAGYDFIADQARGRTLPWAYIGFDWRRLLTEPSGDGRRPYLELLYQTVWYEYLPMSNLVAARAWPYFLPASGALVVAIVPTAAAAIGMGAWLLTLPGVRTPTEVARSALTAMVAAVLVLLVAQEFRWHTWPIMHARLLLPVAIGALASLRAGWNELRRVAPAAIDLAMRLSIAAVAALLLAQHVIDLARVPFRIAH